MLCTSVYRSALRNTGAFKATVVKSTIVTKRTFFGGDYIQTGKFPSRGNYGINILPQSFKYVIERFGRHTTTLDPGLTFLIPFVDKIAYVIDEKEIVIEVDPQIATTDDNVMIRMAGRLFLKFNDPEKAAYGANRPIYATTQFAQSVMRTVAGDYPLDRLFKERQALNTKIVESMQQGVAEWGGVVKRFEVTDLEPTDLAVSNSMHKQSTAERERREILINADAYKKETEKKADAYRYKQEMEAQGNAAKVKLEADAEAYRVQQMANANAFEIEANANAQTKGLEMIASVLAKEGGEQAIVKQLSEKYIEQFGKLAKESNTLVIPQNMSNMSSIIATGMEAYKKVKL